MKKTVLTMAVLAAMLVPAVGVPSAEAGIVVPVAADNGGDKGGDEGGTFESDSPGDDGTFAGRDTRNGRDGRDAREARASRYRVAPGPTFNHPYTNPYTTRTKVISAIRHTRRGRKIRAMTWSFYDSLITDALIDAHRRGVSVRLIMSYGLSTEPDAGANFRRLKAALRHNAGRRPGMRSWARTCDHSCRGGGGAMHFKWISFSRTGVSRNVVMEGSANLNIRAAIDQWNDFFTTKDPAIYNVYQKVFEQSKQDRAFKTITMRSGDYKVWFSPRRDNQQLRLLRRTRCSGPLGTTVIRIAAAVIRGSYGQAIARRLRELDNQGCNILLTFTIMDRESSAIMSGIPKRHLVYDHNDDGLYDEYLHMKAMSIDGRMRNKPRAHVVYQGSANWSNPMYTSDEQGMIINSRRTATKYRRWLTRLFNGAPTAEAVARQRQDHPNVVDPYANVEIG